MKKVMVFGTFDVLHKGHLFLFLEAKKHGDFLIVIVARDKTTHKVKGHKTTFSEKKRLKAVQSVPEVNFATLGHTDDVYRVLEDYAPNVICLGYDQQAFTDKLEKELKKRKILAEIVRLPPYEPEKFKSTLIKKKTKKLMPVM
ncbi:MAG: adenylyltransferase/cytidyltransferase family protein, partial [Candidatus Aenigmarchaeota archaeon]|nr:adenylyltransferase/cytidyltransferase family protein [Candidatus Aenigmarchaeota archaeon]